MVVDENCIEGKHSGVSISFLFCWLIEGEKRNGDDVVECVESVKEARIGRAREK